MLLFFLHLTIYSLHVKFPVDYFPSVGSAIGTQKLQFENASRFVDGMCKFEEFCDDTQITLAVEQYLKRDGGRIEKPSSKDEIPLGKADEAKFNMQCTDVCAKRKKILEDLHGSSKGSKEDRHDTGEKAHENTLKQMTSSCTPQLVHSVSFNDKIEQINCSSPPCQKRKSGVIKLSFNRKSKDGDETTELCKHPYSSFYLFHLMFFFRTTTNMWIGIRCVSCFKFVHSYYVTHFNILIRLSILPLLK